MREAPPTPRRPAPPGGGRKALLLAVATAPTGDGRQASPPAVAVATAPTGDGRRVWLPLAVAVATVLTGGSCKAWNTPQQPAAAVDATTVAPPPRPDASPAPPCGGKDQPLCPLEAWMDRELSAPLQLPDWPHLARSFTRLAAHAPPSLEHWSDFTTRGTAAIRARNLDSLRATCRACHNTYRDLYRQTLSPRPAPP